jgi:hypothetical protein
MKTFFALPFTQYKYKHFLLNSKLIYIYKFELTCGQKKNEWNKNQSKTIINHSSVLSSRKSYDLYLDQMFVSVVQTKAHNLIAKYLIIINVKLVNVWQTIPLFYRQSYESFNLQINCRVTYESLFLLFSLYLLNDGSKVSQSVNSINVWLENDLLKILNI